MALANRDYQVLEILDEKGGFLTRRVALKLTGAGRKQSAWIRQELLLLKKAGLVSELDNQKPVCWKRTPEGTAALARGIERGFYVPHSKHIGTVKKMASEPGLLKSLWCAFFHRSCHQITLQGTWTERNFCWRCGRSWTTSSPERTP